MTFSWELSGHWCCCSKDSANMKFVAVLLLAAVVAASHEEVPAEQVANFEKAVEEHMPFLASSLFKIYGAPAHARDFHLIQEKDGLKGLFSKSFIVAFQDQNEMKSFLLKDGLSALPSGLESTKFLRSLLLSTPEKVGITLSAMRLLDLPQMSLPVRSMDYPTGYSMQSVFRQYQDQPLMPIVFIMEKNALPAASLEKLALMGEFNVQPEAVKILREYPTAMYLDADRIPAVRQFLPLTISEVTPEQRPAHFYRHSVQEPAWAEPRPLQQYITREAPTFVNRKTVVEFPTSDIAKPVIRSQVRNPAFQQVESEFPFSGVQYIVREQPISKKVVEIVPVAASSPVRTWEQRTSPSFPIPAAYVDIV